MKVDIRDLQALGTLRALEVAAYLRASGWRQAQKARGQASIWLRTVDNEEFEALLPLDQRIRDYALRMGDVLRVIAEVEQRSQVEVFNDLATTTADVVRIRIDDPEWQDGTVPIEVHAQLAQKARDLVLAAACAVIERRSIWHTRKPPKAMDHVRRVRIGQSERGSYVLTVISRVPPALHVPAGQLFEAEQPYERLVTKMLADALQAMDNAATQAALTAEFASFEAAVSRGVSANLCDAVAGLWGEDDGQRRLGFTFSWSPARPVEDNTQNCVELSSDRIQVIREAGRILREQAPVSEFELAGAVVKLARPEGAPTGRATIMGLVEGKQKRVTVELADTDYQDAVRAHAQESALQCVGTLVREGKSFVLQNPREVAVEDE